MKESNDILVLFESLNNHEVFTPPRLAKQMLELFPENVWTHPEYKFLDPCVKSGVFLREMFYKLFDGLNGKGKFTADDGITYDLNDNHQRINHIFKNMLYGVATSELTGYVSRRTLYGVMEANSDKQIAAVESFERSKNFTDWTEQQRLDFIGRNQFNDYYDHTIFKTKEYEGFEKEGNIFYPIDEIKRIVVEEGNYLIEDTYFPFIDERTKHRKILDIKEQKMKFDVIIGNPPYQISDGGGGQGSSAKPLYHTFIEKSIGLQPKYLSMIVPSRWMTGGKGLDTFRDYMIKNCKLTKLFDFQDSKYCFPGVDIAGGVNYFLWENKIKNPETLYTTVSFNGEKSTMSRSLSLYDIIIRGNIDTMILEKVLPNSSNFMDSIVSSRKPFGIGSDFKKYSNYPAPGDVKILHSNGIGFIKKELISSGTHYLNQHKVYLSKANGAAQSSGKILTPPIKGEPNSCCTETYLLVPCENENETDNLISYIKTKFFRFMLSIRKKTQNTSKDNFKFVPLLHLNKQWTDVELYQFYRLSPEEISHIESTILEME